MLIIDIQSKSSFQFTLMKVIDRRWRVIYWHHWSKCANRFPRARRPVVLHSDFNRHRWDSAVDVGFIEYSSNQTHVVTASAIDSTLSVDRPQYTTSVCQSNVRLFVRPSLRPSRRELWQNYSSHRNIVDIFRKLGFLVRRMPRTLWSHVAFTHTILDKETP
jgi:hypothetical protein